MNQGGTTIHATFLASSSFAGYGAFLLARAASQKFITGCGPPSQPQPVINFCEAAQALSNQ
jgi:hypothetical protein